ncbi:hypothetical protein Pint_07714 [Pistacia integerrima]|uniref:Uncharacterized protein n=1 Tax=Pistacia integerrima TaxID=434235 RepID=A0ACC0XWF1_9ROSI|nr:hypothetical protein Pint_07714 [Pistacia integerrima]
MHAQELYLWKLKNGEVQMLMESFGDNDRPRSLACSHTATILAVGYMDSKLQL